jgi:hypothetical protein
MRMVFSVETRQQILIRRRSFPLCCDIDSTNPTDQEERRGVPAFWETGFLNNMPRYGSALDLPRAAASARIGQDVLRIPPGNAPDIS